MIGDTFSKKEDSNPCQGGEVEIFEENTTYYLDKAPKSIMGIRQSKTLLCPPQAINDRYSFMTSFGVLKPRQTLGILLERRL